MTTQVGCVHDYIHNNNPICLTACSSNLCIAYSDYVMIKFFISQ